MITSLLDRLDEDKNDKSFNVGQKRTFDLSEEDPSPIRSPSKKLKLNEVDDGQRCITFEGGSTQRDNKVGIFRRFASWWSNYISTEEVVAVDCRKSSMDKTNYKMSPIKCVNYSEKENKNGNGTIEAGISFKGVKSEMLSHPHINYEGSEKYGSAIKMTRVENEFSYTNQQAFRFQPTLPSNVQPRAIRKKYLLKSSYQTESEKKMSSINPKSLTLFKPNVPKLNSFQSKYSTNRSTATTSFLCGSVTAHESFKLDEKIRYKNLLQNFTSSAIQTSGNLTRKFLHRPVGDSIAFQKAQRAGALVKECFSSFWGMEKKSVLEKNKTSIISSPTESIRSKNICKILEVIDLCSDDEKKTFKQKEDDDILITKIVNASPTKNALEERLQTSPFYTGDHFRNRKEQYEMRKKRHFAEEEAVREKTREMEIRRKKHESSLEDKIALRLARLELTYPTRVIEIPKEPEDVLKELTQPIMATIIKAVKGGHGNQVIADKFNIQVTRKDIHTLVGLNWLNDEVINFYMNLIMGRNQEKNLTNVYAFNTFFYPKLIKTGYGSVKRWTKKVDLFSYELLIVPIHLGMHWCLATIDFRDKTVRYYDSMHGDNYRCLQELLSYLESEHADKKKVDYDTSNWKIENIKDIPQQMNGSDCGMFSCKFAEYISRDATIAFSQEHMPYFRQRMIYEICSTNLM